MPESGTASSPESGMRRGPGDRRIDRGLRIRISGGRMGTWIAVGVGGYVVVSVLLGLAVGRVLGALSGKRPGEETLDLEPMLLEFEAWMTQAPNRATEAAPAEAEGERDGARPETLAADRGAASPRP